MDGFELIVSRVHDSRRTGRGVLCRCPAHDDHSPSLSIDRGENGAPLIKCRAGCTSDDILRALGLTWRDVLNAANGHGRQNGSARAGKSHVYPTPEAAAESAARKAGGLVAKLYVWSDDWRRVRIEFADGRPKTFREITRAGGGWILKGPNKPHVLYRVAELPSDGAVYVCEGEKCADAARSIGLPAVTSGSADSAGNADWRPLAGRDCIILPDADAAGARYATAVAVRLIALDPPARVRICGALRPDPPSGFDLADWIGELDGRDGDELRATVERLTAEAPEYNPSVDRARQADAAEGAPRVTVDVLANIPVKQVAWLFPARFALGTFSLVSGAPGEGKSLIMLDLAARITRGAEWPLSEEHAPRGRVILVNCEEDAARVIRPRFETANGDAAAVRIVRDVREVDGSPRLFDLGRDLIELQRIIRETGDVLLVLLDPLGPLLGEADSHNHAETYRLLAPLATLAEETGTAIVAVHHDRKLRAGTAIDRLMGSRAFSALPRNVHAVIREPREDEGQTAPSDETRLFAHAKASLSRKSPALRFRIDATADGVPFVNWLDVVHSDADAILTAQERAADEKRDDGRERSIDRAKALVRDKLAAGPMLAKDLAAAAEAVGIKPKTLRNAKEALGVRADPVRDADGKHLRGWRCSLPSVPAEEEAT